MAYSGTLVKINNTTLPGLKAYSVQRNKLWKDSERNMAGNIRNNYGGKDGGGG